MKPSLISRLVLLTVAANTAHAAGTPITWADSAGNTAWTAGASWTGSAAPTDDLTTDLAIIGSVVNAQPDLDVLTRSVGGVDFQLSGGGATFTSLANAAITLGATGIQASTQLTGTTNVNVANIILGANQTWKIGPSTNTNPGTTDLSATLAISSNIDLNGKTLSLNPQGRTRTTGVIGGLSTTMTLTGAISGNTALTVAASNAGSGGTTAVNLSGDNSNYTGNMTISGGTLTVSNSLASLGSTTTGTTTIGSNASSAGLNITGLTGSFSTDRLVRFQTSAGRSISNNDTDNTHAVSFLNTGAVVTGTASQTFTFGGNNTAANTFAGAIGDAGVAATKITKNGNGKWILTGANSYTGVTTLSSGTLQFAKTQSFYNSVIDATNAALLTVSSGGTAAFNIGAASDEFTEANISTLLGASNGTVGFKTGSFLGLDTTNATGGTYTYGTVIADPNGNSIGLTKLGAGELVLNQANSFTGDKSVQTGTVTVSGNQSASTGSWTLRGYGATGSTYNTVATTVNFEPGSAVTVTTGKTVQLGNTAASGGFQGQTLNANGTVTGTGSLFVGRGGLLNVGGSWTQSGTATVAAQGGGIATMTVTPGGSFIYTSATQFVLNNSSASGTLAVDGGTFTTGVKLHNTNAGAGGTNPAKVVLSNGGTLKLSAAIADLFTTAGGAQSFQVGSGGGIVDTNSFSTTLNVDVSGTGGLTKSGAGTLTTTGVNSYTGDTTVNGGILSVAGPDFDDASSVTIASGSKLNLNFAGTDTVAGLTINGTSLPAGVYSASTHAAFITGTGTLTVTTSGSTPSFGTWASGLGLSGNPDADFDKDGIADAAEYVLGTNPKASSSSGITTQKSGSNLIITFSRDDASMTTDTTLTVEAGSTLAAWPQTFTIGATTGTSSAGVVITDKGASDTVQVTIPTSGAAKLFAHLKVQVTP
jgi:autotransporter-associated beta strand protein